MKWIFYIGAIIVGIALGFQSPMNSALGKIANPKNSAVLNNLLGLAILFLISLPDGSIKHFGSLFKAPAYLLLGGFLGATIVYLSIVVIPAIGAATFASIIVTVQMAVTMLIDHYGLFGMPRTPVNWYRIAGVILMLIGIRLIKK
ncbi:DMT family transporter [Caldanaerobius polysaccharolyticus]|uniref:DMT family transporter n=1 Tax=Caldanaerobius polysaccharolyticus TaxID=44256 RepID=UPI000558AD4B|nr:DMT family transporter [Caldanaerobius polysaccharolyticus]